MTRNDQQYLERLRAETSMVYRLVLVMLAAVTEDGQYSDSGGLAAAVDTCDGVIAARGRLVGAAVAGRRPAPGPAGRGRAIGPDGA